jgi:hypothetical protein
MSARIAQHLRRNLYGLIALFIALGGSAIAANVAAKNTVTSKSIKNAQVKKKDLAANAVDSRKVADDSLTGADIREDTLNGLGASPQGPVSPSGAAGGDLAGSYPDPTIAADAVGAGEVIDQTLTGSDVLDDSLSSADVDESTLGFSPGADITGTMETADIAPNAVGADEVASNSLSGSDISEGGLFIGGDLSGSVGSADINQGTVGGVEVGNRSLSLNDVSAADAALGNTASGITLAPGACTNVLTALNGLQVGDLVIVVPRSTSAGIFTPPVRVTTAGQFPLRMCNFSGTSVTNASADVDVFAMRP